MKTAINLILLLVFSFILRIWQISSIPPINDLSFVPLRFLSAFLSTFSGFLLYLIVKKEVDSNKTALLASFVFLVNPWVIEQSRIVSKPVFALFGILLTQVIFSQKSILSKLIKVILIILVIYFIYPSLWLFSSNSISFNHLAFVKNIFSICSFEFLFFKNHSFWWGGVRDFGILFLTYLPFLLIGFIKVIRKKKYLWIAWMAIFLLIYAANSSYPEGREFFLTYPVFAFITAVGMNKVFKHLFSFKIYLKASSRITFAVLIIFIAFFIYELSQFVHFYTVHYPRQVANNLTQIKDAF